MEGVAAVWLAALGRFDYPPRATGITGACGAGALRAATWLPAGPGVLATNESATALRMNMVPTTQPTDQAKIESVRRSSIAVFPVPRSGRVQEPKRLFIEKVRTAMLILRAKR